jgi:hypothetical protein
MRSTAAGSGAETGDGSTLTKCESLAPGRLGTRVANGLSTLIDALSRSIEHHASLVHHGPKPPADLYRCIVGRNTKPAFPTLDSLSTPVFLASRQFRLTSKQTPP